MEIGQFVVYEPLAEIGQKRAKITKEFIESFHFAPIFLIEEDEDPTTVVLETGTSPIGLCTEPFFDTSDGTVKANIFLTETAAKNNENLFISGIQMFLEEGIDLNKMVVDEFDCKVAAVLFKPGKNPLELEKEKAIQSITESLEPTKIADFEEDKFMGLA